MKINIPIMLTLVRMVVSPLVLPFLLVYLLPLNLFWVNVFLVTLFILLSITDFFDGYLARHFQQVTHLGRILDPIADKFLVYSTVVALLAAGKLFFAVALVLIGREFFVMSLRIIALEHHRTLVVSWLGKLKTIAQMVYLGVVIINPYQQFSLLSSHVNQLELLLLVLTLGLTIWSAYYYYCSLVQAFKEEDNLSEFR